MHTPHSLFVKVCQLLQSSSLSIEEVEALGKTALLKEHEVASIGYALLAKRLGLAFDCPSLHPLASGAIPLFQKGFFPWEGLPYPIEHARLGSFLLQLGELNFVEGMREFQESTLDHNKKPIHSYFSQEGAISFSELRSANDLFFSALGLKGKNSFLDKDLGIIQECTHDKTFVLFASGCKSGMGVFLYQDIGIVNFGPQQFPVGDGKNFGIAGRPSNLKLNETETGYFLSYCTRLASPHPRASGYAGLSDSGYSASWIEAEIEAAGYFLKAMCRFKSFKSQSLSFSFYCKANACIVAGTHKLNPRSLNRYQGPIQKVELKGAHGSIDLETSGEASAMEVIPLAGDDSFWGGDFLITYTLNAPSFAFTFSIG